MFLDRSDSLRKNWSSCRMVVMTAFWSPLLRLNEPTCSWETAWQVLQFRPVECDLYVMGSLQDEIWPAESSMKCALKLVELHRVLMVCYWSWVLASTLAYRSFECTWEVLKQRVAAHACLFVCLDVDAMTRTWHPCMTPVCSMIGTAIIVSHRMMTCLRPGRATAKVWWSQSTSKDGNLF